MVVIDTAESCGISGINIMEMHALSAFTQFSVRRRPFCGLPQIRLRVFASVFAGNIKVNDDMILRNFHIMDPCSIQIRKFRLHVIPSLGRRFLCIGILCRAVRTNIIKNRFLLLHDKPSRGLFFRFVVQFAFFKFFCPEPGVIRTNSGAVFQTKPVAVITEIVLQLFLEYPLRVRECHLGVVTVCLIQFPGGFKSDTIFFLKNMIGVDNEVIEIVGSAEHIHRNIIVIDSRIAQINLLAVIRNGSELEADLFYSLVVFPCTELLAGRGNID